MEACLFPVTLLVLSFCVRETVESGAYLTSGLASCYTHVTSDHGIPGLYTVCPVSCSNSGGTEYLYCSKDQYCCWNDGCYACCVTERGLDGGEIAGIIAGVCISAGIIMGLIVFISFKFWSKTGVH